MSTDAVEQLTALLREAKAVPTLRAESITPSSIYDPAYRAAVVSLALATCGKDVPDGTISLAESKLRLAQFVATHPELLPSLRGWVRAHGQGERPSLEGWARFPRGYAADSIFDRVVTYLVATGQMAIAGKNIVVAADRRVILASFINALSVKELFQEERAVLDELSQMKITLKMLGA